MRILGNPVAARKTIFPHVMHLLFDDHQDKDTLDDALAQYRSFREQVSPPRNCPIAADTARTEPRCKHHTLQNTTHADLGEQDSMRGNLENMCDENVEQDRHQTQESDGLGPQPMKGLCDVLEARAIARGCLQHTAEDSGLVCGATSDVQPVDVELASHTAAQARLPKV